MQNFKFLFKFIVFLSSFFLFASISNNANAEIVSQQSVKDAVTVTLSNNQSVFLPPLALTANLKVNRVTINAENTNLNNTWYFDVLYSCFIHPSNGFLFFSEGGKSRSVSTPTPINISAMNLNLEASQTSNGLMFAGQNCNQEQVYLKVIVRDVATDATIKLYGNGFQIYNVMEDTPPEVPSIDMFQAITADPVIVSGTCDYQGQVIFVTWSLKTDNNELLNRKANCSSDGLWQTAEIFNLWNGNYIFEVRNDTATTVQVIYNFSVIIQNNINFAPFTTEQVGLFQQPIKLLNTANISNNNLWIFLSIPITPDLRIDNFTIHASNTNSVNTWYYDLLGTCFNQPSTGLPHYINIASGNQTTQATPIPTDITIENINLTIADYNCNQPILSLAIVPRNVVNGSINLFGDGTHLFYKVNIPDSILTVEYLQQFKSDGVTEAEEGGNVLGTAMTFKANVSSSANTQVKLQVELRRLDELNGAFNNAPTQESAFVDSGTEATVSVFDLVDGAYHWQARAIDSQGNASVWQEFGEPNNIDFIVIDPVIIVPGIGGSVFDPISGLTLIDPILGTYDNLIEGLEDKGYILHETLFPFPYNWMQDNARTAEDLQDKIADIKNICQCQKVDVIAHSMGGLVTRYYIQSELYQHDIDQFIILGTPHLGAPEIYLLWEGGELQPNFHNFLMKLLLENIAEETEYAGVVSFIRNGPIESIEQLLAVYSYLRSAEDYTYFNYPDGYPRNVFLEELNSDSGLNVLSQSGVNIYNIVGENGVNNTINSIRIVDDPSRWPLWLHGYPENFDSPLGNGIELENIGNLFTDRGLERGEGDKSVPLYSAQHLNISGVKQKQIVSDHRDLPSRAFNIAYEILTGIPTDPIEPTHPVLRFLRIAVLSPVDIQVIDPFGRIVGTNFVNNQIINDISGAYYTGSETTFLEYMTIPNPVDGEYRIVTRGTDSGSYKIKVDIFSEEELTEETFIANTQPGVIENLDFSLNAEELELSEIEPEDTTSPVISSTTIIPEYYLNSVPLQFDYSAQDEGVGLFSVSATFDGQNFESGQLVNFTTPGTHTIVITAKDLVNNVATRIIEFNVIYNFDGFLKPIKPGESYNFGRTLPVSFQLFDVNGQFMPDAIAHLTVAKIENGIVGTEQIPTSSSNADTDNLFRIEDGYYMYNLATSSLDVGTWQLKIVLDDGRVYTTVISLH